MTVTNQTLSQHIQEIMKLSGAKVLFGGEQISQSETSNEQIFVFIFRILDIN